MSLLPVSIVSGFLGAGKTTLLNRLLSDPRGVRFGVLVNDFGALNIDAELIKETGQDRIALTNGCVCCTIRNDLIAAAFDVAGSDLAPDHILVETSGVSNPMSVAEAFFGELAARKFTVDGIYCLIDAENFPGLGYADTELAIDQAAVADIVILNKCDLVGDAQLADVERTLRGALPVMRILRATEADVPRDVLTGTRHGKYSGIADGGTNDHGQDFVSWAWRTDRPLHLEDFKSFVKALPPTIFRSKGVLRFIEAPGQRAVFHLVGKRSSLAFAQDESSAEISALVAIGRRDAVDAGALDRLFDRFLGGAAPAAPLSSFSIDAKGEDL